MQYMAKAVAAVVLAASALSGCKVDADWERTIGTEDDSLQRVEWLQDMSVTDKGHVIAAVQSIVVGTNRKVDILLSELDASGHSLWQRLYNLGEDEQVSQLLAAADGYYLLSNTSDGESQLLALNKQGEQRWLYRYQDGAARNMKRIGNKLYLTGQRSLVINMNGELLVDVHHNNDTWAVETGLLGEFFIASNQGVAAYDDQGNQLWHTATQAAGLLKQVDLVWQDGALYVATAAANADKAWLTKLNVLTGAREWQRELASPSQGFNSDLGPVLMEGSATGNILLVQSYELGRQVTQLNPAGDVEWQINQDSGIAQDIALDSDNQLLVAGSGIAEQYITEGSEQGQRAAWASQTGEVQSTTGEVEVFGDSVYVGASVERDGRIQAVITHYSAK